MAEVQRAVAAAMAESRATERLRNHRYHENLPVSQQQQRTQQPIRPNAFVRLQAETASSSTIRTTTGATPTAANATSSSNDDGDKESHLTSTIGSVSQFIILQLFIYNSDLQKSFFFFTNILH